MTGATFEPRRSHVGHGSQGAERYDPVPHRERQRVPIVDPPARGAEVLLCGHEGQLQLPNAPQERGGLPQRPTPAERGATALSPQTKVPCLHGLAHCIESTVCSAA